VSGGGLRDAAITIVGGGAVGCAVAYVLARAGYPDIQVVGRPCCPPARGRGVLWTDG